MRTIDSPHHAHVRGFIILVLVLTASSLLANGLCAQESGVTEGATQEVTKRTFGDLVEFHAGRMYIRKKPGTQEEVRIWEKNVRFSVPYGDSMVTFRADKVVFEPAKDVITATGNVVIEDGTSTVRSHVMVYEARERRALFTGVPHQSMSVTLSQKLEGDLVNSYETEWLRVTFGESGLDEIETGPGHGTFYLTGEEPLPMRSESGEEPSSMGDVSPLPRIISPPDPSDSD